MSETPPEAPSEEEGAPDVPDLPDTSDLPSLSDEREVSIAPRRTALEAIEQLTGIAPSVYLPGDDDTMTMINVQSEEVKQAPRQTGQYQIMGEIARGGVGIILKGQDADLGRDVAMKILRPDHADKVQMIQRFVEEAQIGGQLQHPGIIPVYELGVREDGRPFFTMKLVKGRTLGALLLERKEPSDQRARFVSIFEDVCQTVAYAHSKGVVHRDLKPSNIMVGAFGEVLVVDWGLAKVLARGGTADEKKPVQTLVSQVSVVETVRTKPGSTGSESLAGSVLGTPGYMAPEQARGEVEKVDQRADVFSLGCILCELLTGEPPYSGTPEEILLMAAGAHLDDALKRLDKCGADRELTDLAKACLAPAVSARPKDASVVAEKVHAYAAAADERLRHAELTAAEARHKRRITTMVAMGVLLFVVAGGGGWWFWTSQRAASQRQTDAAVLESLGESKSLLSSERLDEAEAALVRAEAALASGDASPGLAEQVGALHREIETSLGQRRFLARLESVMDAGGDAGETPSVDSEAGAADLEGIREDRLRREDTAYRTAFEEFGFEIVGLPLDEAVTAVRDSGVAVEICRALDAWVATRRGLGGADDPVAQHLLKIGLTADLDPGRMELRQAVLSRDVSALRRLATPENALGLPPVTLHALASALLQLGAYDIALTLVDEALRVNRDDAKLHLAAASALDRLGRVEEGIPYLTSALALQPGSLDTMVRLGTAYHRARDFERAHAMLDDAIRLHPDAGEPWLRKDWIAYAQRRDARERSEMLEEGLRRAPARYGLIGRLVTTYEIAHGRAATVRYLLDHAEAHSDDADVLVAVGRGLSNDRLRATEEAVRILEQAIDRDPENAEAWRRLAAVVDAIDLERAAAAARESVRLDPNNAWGHNLVGFAVGRLGQAEAADEAYRAALAVDPNYSVSGTNLVYSLGRQIEAEEQSGSERELPDEPWMWIARSFRAANQGDLDAAETFARRAVRMAPELWAAHEVLGRAMLETQRWEEAADAYRARADLHPTRNNNFWLIETLLILGRTEEALRQARLAVGARRNATTLAMLGQVLFALGRGAEAERWFEDALIYSGKELGHDPIYNVLWCRSTARTAPEESRYDTLRRAQNWASANPSENGHRIQALAFYRVEEFRRAKDELGLIDELRADDRFALALVEHALGDEEEAERQFDLGMRRLIETRVQHPIFLRWRDEAAEALYLDPEDWEEDD